MRKLVDRLKGKASSKAIPDGAGTKRKLRIISWNLLHRSGALVSDISALIEQENPDLFLMQEVTEIIQPLSDLVGGRYYEQSWPGRRHGLAAWSRSDLIHPKPLQLPESKLPGKFPTRFAQLLEIGDLSIANVHLSHGQLLNRRQLRLIARSTEGPTAIIGDYNLLGPAALREFKDVGPRETTHHAQEIMPFRLDRCMVRELHCVASRTLLKGPSDHRPILLEFDHPLDESEAPVAD